MKIKCDCGFEELPENFHAVQYYRENGEHPQRIILIACPICGTSVFFQHFMVDDDKYLSVDTNNTAFSLSHLIAATHEEAKTQEEAQKVSRRKLEELKEKYKDCIKK